MSAPTEREHRLAESVASLMPSGWRAMWWNDIEHVPDCECEAADGYVIEEMDPRCSEGPSHPALVYDDGSYVLWAIDLSEITLAVEAWSRHEMDYGAVLGAVLRAVQAAAIEDGDR